MIKCPKCGTDSPDFKTREGVEMNFCAQGCKGVWFDRGELALYCETETNIINVTERLAEACPTVYKCPRCPDSTLLEIPYLQGENVLVDWCPQCRGVFLDPKELAKVQELANRHATPSQRLRLAASQLAEQGYTTGVRGSKIT